jgi:hypothetical protein
MDGLSRYTSKSYRMKYLYLLLLLTVIFVISVLDLVNTIIFRTCYQKLFENLFCN